MDADASPSDSQHRKAREAHDAEQLLRQAAIEKAAHSSASASDALAQAPDCAVLWAQEEEDTPAFLQYLEKGAQSLWGVLGAENGPAKAAEGRQAISWTVVLSRSKQEKWGFAWDKYQFYAKEQRVVQRVVPGSVAAKWNEKAQASGHAETCILAGDRLICANGRTTARELAAALEGNEVVLEFERPAVGRAVQFLPRTVSEPSPQKDTGIVQAPRSTSCSLDTDAQAVASGDMDEMADMCDEMEGLEEASAAPMSHLMLHSPQKKGTGMLSQPMAAMVRPSGPMRSLSGRSEVTTPKQSAWRSEVEVQSAVVLENISTLELCGKEKCSSEDSGAMLLASQRNAKTGQAVDEARISAEAEAVRKAKAVVESVRRQNLESEAKRAAEEVIAEATRAAEQAKRKIEEAEIEAKRAEEDEATWRAYQEASRRANPLLQEPEAHAKAHEAADSQAEGQVGESEAPHKAEGATKVQSDEEPFLITPRREESEAELKADGHQIRREEAEPDASSPQPLSPSVVPARSTSSEGNATGSPEFQLTVQFGNDRVEVFKFHVDSNIAELVEAFALSINLNVMFKEGLLAHAILMAQTLRQVDEVDVVDLL